MEVTPEIFQVGGSGLTSPEDAAVYLIDFDGRAALVDAGCGFAHERLMSNIRDRGVRPEQIEYLFITHCHFDHTGGAVRLRGETGCQIVAHELDAAFLEAGDKRVTAAGWYGATPEPFALDINW